MSNYGCIMSKSGWEGVLYVLTFAHFCFAHAFKKKLLYVMISNFNMWYVYDDNISDLSNYGCIIAKLVEQGDFMCWNFLSWAFKKKLLYVKWSQTSAVYIRQQYLGSNYECIMAKSDWAGGTLCSKMCIFACRHFQEIIFASGMISNLCSMY